MMKTRFLVKLYTCFSLGACAFNASAILDNGAQFTPDGSKIVFHSYRDNAGELWSMNKDGSDLKKITQGNNHDRWPVISADGKKIAFASKRNGNWDVFTINIDGSGLQQVSDTPVNELGGALSPDGKHIVFAQAGQDNTLALILANADGSSPKKIATGGAWPIWNAVTNKILFAKWGKDDRGTYVYDVATQKETLVLDKSMGAGKSWSQDGQWIFGTQTQAEGFRLFKVRADGTHFTDLGLKGQMDSRPMVSPDGTTLVWGHGRFGDPDIFSYDFSSKKETNLTPNSSWERYIDVNPKTGERVVSSRKSGNSELYLYANNGDEIKLTNTSSNEMGARWSPDGNYLVYGSNETGTYNVYVMDRSGHNVKQLTFNQQTTLANDWSADGKNVVASIGRWGSKHMITIDIHSGKTSEIKLAGRSVLDGTYSPNGSSLVYAASVDGGYELIVRNLHSNNDKVLYSIDGDIYSLNMSPDGTTVAYASDKDGDSEIYIAKMDGSGISQVTDNYREDNNPQWLADSKSLVFDSNRYNNFESFKINVDGSGRTRISP